MTENEAIKHLTLCKESRMFIPNNNVLDIAIQSLKKQIPFKPKGTHIPICGVCNDVMDLAQGNLNYCPNCGQKIAW